MRRIGGNAGKEAVNIFIFMHNKKRQKKGVEKAGNE